MTDNDYKRLRVEISNPYDLLSTYARVEKDINTVDFDKYFPTWCSKASGNFPLQISMNMIISYLDEKHKYVN